jgi:hypothetical protein
MCLHFIHDLCSNASMPNDAEAYEYFWLIVFVAVILGLAMS